MQSIDNFIDGQMRAPISGEYLDVFEPATGRPYARVADSGEREVGEAVEAAERAFVGWSRTPAAQRSRILLKLADLIEDNLERLARAESIDVGKPISLARSLDIPRAAANFRFFGSAILHFASESHATDDLAINYTLRQPRGVVGVISPWNLPLYLLTWKAAPALAVGNTVVAKPSELTPMTAHLLGELCREAGLPAGVLNIVHGRGSEAGAALVRHPIARTISFTGGTATGAQIAATAGPMFKRVALELGGKNANLVFADTDFRAAVEESVRAGFANSGQLCLCGSRVYVEQPIYERFVAELVSAVGRLKVGDPLEATTTLGPVVSRTHLEKVQSYVQLARKEGGRLLCGAEALPAVSERCKGGYFVAPALVTDLAPDCRVNREEIFGPVVTVTPFYDEAEAVALANATDYGLSASLWTSDVARAHRVARQLEAGTVWINCWLIRDLRVPFGGVKQSGVGREGGLEALRFFTEPKNVCVKLDSPETSSAR